MGSQDDWIRLRVCTDEEDAHRVGARLAEAAIHVRLEVAPEDRMLEDPPARAVLVTRDQAARAHEVLGLTVPHDLAPPWDVDDPPPVPWRGGAGAEVYNLARAGHWHHRRAERRAGRDPGPTPRIFATGRGAGLLVAASLIVLVVVVALARLVAG